MAQILTFGESAFAFDEKGAERSPGDAGAAQGRGQSAHRGRPCHLLCLASPAQRGRHGVTWSRLHTPSGHPPPRRAGLLGLAIHIQHLT